jgi:membrane protein insertase Oxa1/YidC/SpoIIIJ
MDLMMPAMTLWFTFSFSAMMGLYWIYQSIIGIIQTVILAKLMPIPKYTEEELKAMEKARKVQEKAQNAIIKTQPKYKSLHYIDEDDYDELPEVKSQTKKNDTKPPINSDKPEIKD